MVKAETIQKTKRAVYARGRSHIPYHTDRYLSHNLTYVALKFPSVNNQSVIFLACKNHDYY